MLQSFQKCYKSWCVPLLKRRFFHKWLLYLTTLASGENFHLVVSLCFWKKNRLDSSNQTYASPKFPTLVIGTDFLDLWIQVLPGFQVDFRQSWFQSKISDPRKMVRLKNRSLRSMHQEQDSLKFIKSPQIMIQL